MPRLFPGYHGSSVNHSEYLIRSSGTTLPTLNGDIADEVTKTHDFCQGAFTGTPAWSTACR
jgi:hypothetical protein